MITIKTTLGNITVELEEKKAPITVKNFLQYIDEGFYKGTIFHRVIDGFMIQGGGFDKDMNQKQTNDPIKNEADNGLKNEIYTIAMARTSVPHSATSQFFINVGYRSFVKGDPAAILLVECRGETEAQLDSAIEKMKATKTGTTNGHQDVPSEVILIEDVSTDKN